MNDSDQYQSDDQNYDWIKKRKAKTKKKMLWTFSSRNLEAFEGGDNESSIEQSVEESKSLTEESFAIENIVAREERKQGETHRTRQNKQQDRYSWFEC